MSWPVTSTEIKRRMPTVNTRRYEARLKRNPGELSILDDVIVRYYAESMDDAENIACGFAGIMLHGEVIVDYVQEIVDYVQEISTMNYQNGEFPTVTICGSMRYYDEMIVAANELTKRGYIVLMPFVTWIKPEDQVNNPIKEMLDKMHFAKIDMSDVVAIVGEYRGESTINEINYAKSHTKVVVDWHSLP